MDWYRQTLILMGVIIAGPLLVGLAAWGLLAYFRHPLIGIGAGIAVVTLINAALLVYAETGFIRADRECADAMAQHTTVICGEYLGLGIIGLPIVLVILLGLQAGLILIIGGVAILLPKLAGRLRNRNQPEEAGPQA